MIIFADIYTYTYIILYSRRLVRSIDRKRDILDYLFFRRGYAFVVYIAES